MARSRGRSRSGRGGGDKNDDKNALKLVTPPFRGSFVRLRKAEGYQGGGDKKFSIVIPLPEDDEFWTELEEKIDAACVKRWDTVPKKFKDPIREGDDTDYEDFEGKLFVRASSEDRPGILDEDGESITDMEGVYSGRWYRAVVRPYAWQHPKSGKGVSLQLDNVLLVNAPKGESDEAFSGRGDAADDFEGYIEGGGASSKRRNRDEDEDEGRGSRRSRGRGRSRDRDEDEDEDRSSRRRRGGKSDPLD